MTLLLEDPIAADEQTAQLLFKEARQRRRRLRFFWSTIVTIVVVALVGFGLIFNLWSTSVTRSVATNTQPGWPAHLRTGATLVYAFNDLRVIDADSGRSRVLPLPAPSGGSGDLGMVSIGNSLLLNRGDTAWLYSPGIDSAPADLGPSDGVFRGPSSNEAWIWSQPCAPILGCTNYNAPRMGSVQLIDSTGRKIGDPVTLPGDTGWYPMGFASTAGIVLAELPTYGDHSNKEEIWNPLTNQVVRAFADSYVIGASGNQIVWQVAAPYCTPDAPCTCSMSGPVLTERFSSPVESWQQATLPSRPMDQRLPLPRPWVAHLASRIPRPSTRSRPMIGSPSWWLAQSR